MVLSDEDGVTLASSGEELTCQEIAAHLPLLGQRVERFEGVLFSPDRGWEIGFERFNAAGAELYLCAVGGNSNRRATQIRRSIGGVSRILEERAQL
jgi:hypothetical protein